MRDELLKIAMKFQIKSNSDFQDAVSIEDVLKVLKNIYQSYQNFIEIEFFKNENLKRIYKTNDLGLKTIKKELKLLVVDLNYGSFNVALAPKLDTNKATLFKDEVNEWKNKSYSYYKNKIFNGNFNDLTYLEEIEKLYNEAERAKIFTPLFNSVKEDKLYKVNIKKSDDNQKQLILPEKSLIQFYTSKTKIEKKKEKDYKNITVYMRIDKECDIYNIKKSNIEKIFCIKEFEHDTYPYNPDIIKFNNVIYNLKDKLDCIVQFEDDYYIISNADLDITVWDDTREGAEKSFCFTFDALYKTFALEDDNKLTKEAQTTKDKLLKIVKGVSYTDEN